MIYLGPIIRDRVLQSGSAKSQLPRDALLFRGNVAAGYGEGQLSAAELALSKDLRATLIQLDGDIDVVQIETEETLDQEGECALMRCVDAALSNSADAADHPDNYPDNYPRDHVLWWHRVVTKPSLDNQTIPAGLTEPSYGNDGSVAVRSGVTFVKVGSGDEQAVLAAVVKGIGIATASWIDADRADRVAGQSGEIALSGSRLAELESALNQCHRRLRAARYLDGLSRISHELAIREWTIVGSVEGSMQRLAERQRDEALRAERNNAKVLDVVVIVATVISLTALIDFVSAPELTITNLSRFVIAATLGVFGAILAWRRVRL